MTTINSLKQPTMQQLKTLTIAATASFAAVFSPSNLKNQNTYLLPILYK